MVSEEDADKFASKLAAATQRVVRDYKEEDVVHEEPFSDQLCGRLKETLEEFETPNIKWQTEVDQRRGYGGRLKARSLTKGQEEPDLGADIVMTLDLDMADYSVRKGFLAQAKRLEYGKRLSSDRHKELIAQCEKMLNVTPASMVFLYGVDGVFVIPATAVVSLRSADLWGIETYDISVLYRDFAICWFGDRRIQSTDRTSLEGLRAISGAQAAIRFVGRER